MRRLLLAAFFLLASGGAFATIPYFTGPLDPSALLFYFNSLIQQINGAMFGTTGTTCPVGVTTCVTPTGVAATDTLNLQNAVNTDFAIVMLVPGTFKLNALIGGSHRNVQVVGWANTYPAGLGGSTPPYPAAVTVDCSAVAHSGRAGCFNVTNQSWHFSGFRIYGNAGLGLNCISMGDSGLVVDGNMQLENCYTGIYIDAAVGTTSGFALNEFIHDISIPYAFQFAIYCNCTDYMFGPDIGTEVAGANYTGGGPVGGDGAVGIASGAIHGRIQGNFFSDGSGAACLYVQGAETAFNNNECANSVGVAAFGGAASLQVNDNTFFNSTPHTFQAIQFAGTNLQVQMNNNFFYYGYSACFFVAGGSTLGGYLEFFNNQCIVFSGFNDLLYNDTTTETAIDPFAFPKQRDGSGAAGAYGYWATLTNTSGTLSAPDWAQGLNVIIPLVHGVTNSLPNPRYTFQGQTGLFGVKQSATGTDTVGTYGTEYIGTFASPSTGAGITDVYTWTTSTNGNILIGAKVGSIPNGS